MSYEVLELILVAIIVIGALAYLALHWSGTLAKWKSRGRPDVQVSSLVRRARQDRERRDDDCCR